MDSGAEQRRQLWTFPKYDVSVQYDELDFNELRTLYAFYMARRGAYEGFFVFDLASLAGIILAHESQYVGRGDGVTTSFAVPGKNTSAHKFYVDGSELGSTFFSVTPSAGADGADLVEFTSGYVPHEHSIISCDFTGDLRMRVRFAKDKQDYKLFAATAYTTGVELYGLGPE
jgi:uncharacterized protein (TIGR02217 family)